VLTKVPTHKKQVLNGIVKCILKATFQIEGASALFVHHVTTLSVNRTMATEKRHIVVVAAHSGGYGGKMYIIVIVIIINFSFFWGGKTYISES
jgi:hypothetical protein